MKKYFSINLFILFILSFFFTSCEDPIDVDVEAGEPKLVIDAFVSNTTKNQYIYLSRSIPYFNNPSEIQGVEDAQILLIDTTLKKFYTFSDSGNGKYVFKPNPISGDTFTVGSVYALFVRVGNDTLYSLSKMNASGHIDSLKVVEEKGTIGFTDGKYVELAGRDRIGKGNTYWIKSFYNDTFRGRIFEMNLAYDEAFSASENDGGIFIWPIRYGAINDFTKPYRKGDKVRVEIHSLTLETFYYLSTIQGESQNGGLFATPPVSIGSNIVSFNQNKKIKLAGWFNMAAVEQREIIIP